MIYETLHDAEGRDRTRLKRAFGWVITFRDFPAGSWQTVKGDTMMTEAVTYFTKGRAEFYLDGDRHPDRVPGILSCDHDPIGLKGTFTIRYLEPTTRLCIPGTEGMNSHRIPKVTQFDLKEGETMELPSVFRGLVCLGQVKVGEKLFDEEQCFSVDRPGVVLTAMSLRVLLLDFAQSTRPK
jgi:hypothetical protein